VKQFDDIFREKVKKAFGSYNADHLADRGWNSFVAKKKKRRWLLLILPFWAKAASMAILIGIGSFFAYHISTRHLLQEKISVDVSSIGKETKTDMPETKKETIPADVATVSEPVRREAKAAPSIPVITENPDVLEELPAVINTIPVENVTEELNIQLPVVAERRTKLPADTLNLTAGVSLKVFQEEEVEKAGETEPEKSSGKTSFMAGFSGLLAQADEATSASHGIAMGFYLDQEITKRISVRPGLVMSRNSFGIENRNGMTGSSYSVPLNDGTSGKVDSYNGQFDMIAMELPLNFVFKISGRQRSGFYVSAGASTMIYISQKFTGDFVNEYTKMSYAAELNAFTSETRYSKVEVQNHYGAFSRTDFFRLINLSAGYSLPYGKSGTLIIEPFLQLPVDELTSLNLRVRYGGLSMKIRFGKEAQSSVPGAK
jgi:hypothetical protein